MGMYDIIAREMESLKDDREAVHLSRFFKTAPGQYGEGDRFLGIRVPMTRSIVKKYRHDVNLSDAAALVESPWHEIRLAGFLAMIEIYRRSKNPEEVISVYLDSLCHANNWDLVDLSAPYILGDYLSRHPDKRTVLDNLAAHENLWHQRTGIVATLGLIRKGELSDTLRLAETLLPHTHDLIHKASGWMLREAGKKDEDKLLEFLDSHASSMPRTMLRYAIERLSPDIRKHYLSIKRTQA